MPVSSPAGGPSPGGVFVSPGGNYDIAMTNDLTEIELIVVGDTATARTALESAAAAGRRITLLSPAATSAAMGPGIFAEIVEIAGAGLEHALAGAVFDCADAAGLAMAALRRGGMDVLTDLDGDALAKLDELAEAQGRRVLRCDDPALTIRAAEDLQP
jgi:hypothetical protein